MMFLVSCLFLSCLLCWLIVFVVRCCFVVGLLLGCLLLVACVCRCWFSFLSCSFV